jgi:plasmid stabilization system protein ParE
MELTCNALQMNQRCFRTHGCGYLAGRKNGTRSTYSLSEAAAHDFEQFLHQSILDFGLLQTEAYHHNLTHCLALLADNPEMGNSAEDTTQTGQPFNIPSVSLTHSMAALRGGKLRVTILIS